MSECYCGLPESFDKCCEPIINGKKLAKTAEQLMRARYSAYSIAAVDFLHDSLHPDSRDSFDAEATKQWAETSKWQGLTILEKKAGNENDSIGIVCFTASFEDENGKLHKHSEQSQFKKIDGNWYFCDGHTITPQKIGRNDPCSCGSGKKYKKCCGA